MVFLAENDPLASLSSLWWLSEIASALLTSLSSYANVQGYTLLSLRLCTPS